MKTGLFAQGDAAYRQWVANLAIGDQWEAIVEDQFELGVLRVMTLTVTKLVNDKVLIEGGNSIRSTDWFDRGTGKVSDLSHSLLHNLPFGDRIPYPRNKPSDTLLEDSC